MSDPKVIEYSRKEILTVFNGKQVSPILSFANPETDRAAATLVENANGRLSLSGVQPKYAVVVDDGKIRLTKDGERGTHILKPPPASTRIFERIDCPANEHLSMQIAEQVYKIDTAKNAICFFPDGTPAYITRRFDIKPDGDKYAMEDLASIAGISRDTSGDNYKYDILSYEECGEIIKEHTNAPKVEMLKFFRMVLYNYIISNDDAHIKNFTLIETTTGNYTLSPAYDLLNTFLHLASPGIFALSKGLFKEGMTQSDLTAISQQDFIEFGDRLGIPSRIVQKEIKTFASEQSQALNLIDSSFLSNPQKETYRDTYLYRVNTLKR